MAFTLSFDASAPAGLANLNVFLQSRSYVVSFHATQTDVELFNAIGKAPDASAYPNVARFYSHIASFTAEQRSQWPAAFGASKASVPAKAAAAAPKAAPKPAEAEDDAAGLFGDDDDAAAAVASAAAAAAEKPAEKKKEKKVELNKTAVIYEVKPLEAGQDMKELEAAIRSIEIDGLVWGEEFKVLDVAFGIQKIVCQCIVEDEKVGLADIEEKLESFTELIQSIDMLNMNKVSGR